MFASPLLSLGRFLNDVILEHALTDHLGLQQNVLLVVPIVFGEAFTDLVKVLASWVAAVCTLELLDELEVLLHELVTHHLDSLVRFDVDGLVEVQLVFVLDVRGVLISFIVGFFIVGDELVEVVNFLHENNNVNIGLDREIELEVVTYACFLGLEQLCSQQVQLIFGLVFRLSHLVDEALLVRDDVIFGPLQLFDDERVVLVAFELKLAVLCLQVERILLVLLHFLGVPGFEAREVLHDGAAWDVVDGVLSAVLLSGQVGHFEYGSL